MSDSASRDALDPTEITRHLRIYRRDCWPFDLQRIGGTSIAIHRASGKGIPRLYDIYDGRVILSFLKTTASILVGTHLFTSRGQPGDAQRASSW